jgi:hypothetical protein
VHGVDDLEGLVIGVQQGNTSQPVAEKLVADGRAARVRLYAYDEIETALGDLSSGGCDAFMKLAPVTALAGARSAQARVVQTGITREILGASACARATPCCAMRSTRHRRASRKTALWPALIKQWLGEGADGAPRSAALQPRDLFLEFLDAGDQLVHRGRHLGLAVARR